MSRGTDVTNMKKSYRTVVEGEFPDNFNIELEKESELRYGENPNQPAAMYRLKGTSLAELTNIRLAKSGKGGLSATNFMDVTRALEILKFFDMPAVSVMKHLVPSGFARQFNGTELSNIYEKARDADTRSAFGSIVVFNRSVDKASAEAIASTYVEGVAAPEFEEGALGILEGKKDLRAILYSNLNKIPKFVGDDVGGIYDFKGLPTGRVLVQKPYLTSIKGPQDLILDPLVQHEGTSYVVNRNPNATEISDLLTAWYVNLGVRSNGIVFVKDGATVAVGTGQQERVGAVEQAIIKAYQKAMDREVIKYDAIDGAVDRLKLSSNPLKGAVISSDAFFPFRDSIDTIAKHSITAVIQPGGSVRDYEVISAINEHEMAMVYTLERCFGHF
jgi:phosphoribosylaminoimidazolecarboxamide formyltransferase / IMP cyclohydrolase